MPDPPGNEYAVTDEALLETGRRALLGRLTPGALHEMANPLLALTGTAQLLLETAEPGTKTHERLGVVDSMVEEIAEVVRLLQRLSRERLEGEQSIELADFVAETVAIVRRLSATRDVSIDEDYRGESHVTARPAVLRQAIAWLLLDAIEASQPRGRVEIALDGAALRVAPGRTAGDPALDASVRALRAQLELRDGARELVVISTG
jgi:two-component system sensor histidine kinase PilS (NtrC family)